MFALYHFLFEKWFIHFTLYCSFLFFFEFLKIQNIAKFSLICIIDDNQKRWLYFLIEQKIIRIFAKQKNMKIVVNFHKLWQFKFHVFFSTFQRILIVYRSVFLMIFLFWYFWLIVFVRRLQKGKACGLLLHYLGLFTKKNKHKKNLMISEIFFNFFVALI